MSVTIDTMLRSPRRHQRPGNSRGVTDYGQFALQRWSGVRTGSRYSGLACRARLRARGCRRLRRQDRLRHEGAEHCRCASVRMGLGIRRSAPPEGSDLPPRHDRPVHCPRSVTLETSRPRKPPLAAVSNVRGAPRPQRFPRKLGVLSPSNAAAPYSDRDLVRLRNWANSQSTPFRRTNAAVLLALGAGAGLSASEIGRLRIGRLRVDAAGVVVDVDSERMRTVPVLRAWEEVLIERAAALPPGSYAFRENHTVEYPNLISSFVVRSGTMTVRPTSQRLRATWIVTHLRAGTPVVDLMRAAGVESLEAFTRYVKFVEPREAHASRVVLRR